MDFIVWLWDGQANSWCSTNNSPRRASMVILRMHPPFRKGFAICQSDSPATSNRPSALLRSDFLTTTQRASSLKIRDRASSSPSLSSLQDQSTWQTLVTLAAPMRSTPKSRSWSPKLYVSSPIRRISQRIWRSLPVAEYADAYRCN